MEPYERIKIADALKPQFFKAGQLLMKQGDIGDQFYFLEEGECVCLKVMKPGSLLFHFKQHGNKKLTQFS